MKIQSPFKPILLSTLGGLFLTGVLVWILQTWFLQDHGFGPEAPASRIWFLKLHSVLGLLFLILFGYLIRSHIEPGLKRPKSRRSGLLLVILFGTLIATVPALFYLTNDELKSKVAFFHTYMGLFLIMPFLVHLPGKVLGRGPFKK